MKKVKLPIFLLYSLLGLVFGLTTQASAAGKVTTSIKLPVSGMIFMSDGSQVNMSGMVHVVSQVYEMSDGEMMVSLRANTSNLKGVSDNVELTKWIGVGGDQFPPDPIFPNVIYNKTVPFDLIPLDNGGVPPNPVIPPDPISPVAVQLSLNFDANGKLLLDSSMAMIGGQSVP
jgi:hypothetical protein